MKKIFLIAAASAICINAAADEGMWMASRIGHALEKQMQERGLEISASDIYNENGNSICGSVVSMDFACTGSIISEDGLVITNHHCAYSDVYSLSTDEHNYLEDGYWAFYQKDEIPIKGKSIEVLKKVIDVTDEVKALIAKIESEGKIAGSRKISHEMEEKYSKETGLDASLDAMWGGSKYYISLYLTYTDIRLVAAPPVSIAAFGGDIDNWEWPQHKGDFALYRIYTGPDGKPAEYSEDNVPLQADSHLTISREGYGEGSYAMVIGYPGRTDRYYSAARVKSMTETTLPISNELRGKQMEIMKGWMDKNPSIRLMYSDHFFSLSNVQELYEGEVQCCRRFGVYDDKKMREKELQEWILADPERTAEWGGIIDELDSKWAAAKDILKDETYFRETMVRGSRLGIVSLRLISKQKPTMNAAIQEYSSMNMDVEGDLFRYTLEQYYENVNPKWWGPFQTSLKEKYGDDYDAIYSYLWNNSVLVSQEWDKCEDFAEDPLCKFYTEVKSNTFSNALADLDGEVGRTELEREYTHALYEMREDKGIAQYPDANSTLRISYGTVGGVEPHDGVICSWKSTAKGVLEKYNPDDYDFSLKPEWKNIVGSYDGPVDFLSDNDITGGNSGSPVLDSKGRLIGLAFDGNKESLASDFSFTPGYNKCVSVDIRYVLFILEEYAHLGRIIDEIEK